VFSSFDVNAFHFRCGKDISCFNTCCAKLRLILTPYDILRIKGRLGITSDEFLEKYTVTILEDHSRFPMVSLKMAEDNREDCPFVTGEGCFIYEDRPGACRLYPLGRASAIVKSSKDVKQRYFIVDESDCLGLKESRAWTIEEWLHHEGVHEYNTPNDEWLEIITSPRTLGQDSFTTQKLQMFFMASYNLDKFRKFIFETRFLDLFEISSQERKRVVHDDLFLMRFGFRWLKFSLFAEKTMQLKA
jgi:Fe-S-cluster containining protein